MRTVLKGALAAALLAGGSLTAAAPAEAHDRGGTAVIAGLFGLGLGAAIASDHHHYEDRRAYAYDDGRGYERPGYNDGYGYERAYYPDRRYGGYSDRRYDGYPDRHNDGWDRRGWDDRGYYGR